VTEHRRSLGTTGLSIGQRVFGLTDWTRDGTLAEYVAVEARNLAPLPGDVDFTVGASLPMPGLTAWQGLFEHGRLWAGQSVLAHGAAGVVGSMVTQLARDAGAYVIGTGRAACGRCQRERWLEPEMTKHIAPLPVPDGSLLLRELNHRVNNELTSSTISAKAVESDDVAVKAAVDLLHGYTDVHKALRMPGSSSSWEMTVPR
jgi:hypothetical protein